MTWVCYVAHVIDGVTLHVYPKKEKMGVFVHTVESCVQTVT